MKLVLAAVAALALAIPASASASQSPCDHNPTDLCDSVVVTVDQPTAAECPAGGFVLVVDAVRYPICNGVNGAGGQNGAPGADGAPGSPGADGAAGPTGAAGSAGVAGLSGTDGAAGPERLAQPVDSITTVISQPRQVRRAAKCERRLNSAGRLVIVCKRMTCPRRASKANPRRLVVKCPRAHKRGKV